MRTRIRRVSIAAALVAFALCVAPASGARALRSWAAPTAISGTDTVFAFDAASNASGDRIAVWTTSSGGNWVVRAARQTGGAGAWTTTTLVTTDHEVDEPIVAINAAGDAVAAWRDQTPFFYHSIVGAYFAAGPGGGTWTDAEPIPSCVSGTDGDVSRPSAAVEPGGDALVAWNCQPTVIGSDSWQTIPEAARYVTSAPVGWVATDGIADVGDNGVVRVAAGPSGRFAAVWLWSDGTSDAFDVHAAVLDEGATSWSAVDRVGSSVRSGTTAAPLLDAAGALTVAWQDGGAGAAHLLARRRAPAGGWGGVAELSSGAQDAVVAPQLVPVGSGDALAVWGSAGTGGAIHAVRISGTAPDVAQVRIADVAVAASGDDVVAGRRGVGVDGAGNVLVAWRQGPDGGAQTIASADLDAGATRWSAQSAASTPSGVDEDPVLALAADGSAGAIWLDGALNLVVAESAAPGPDRPRTTPPATPRGIVWTPALRKGKLSVAARRALSARFTGAAGVTYAIAATRGTTRTTGVCTRTGAKVRCTIRLQRTGAWTVSITPRKAGVAGTPARQSVRVRPAPRLRRVAMLSGQTSAHR